MYLSCASVLAFRATDIRLSICRASVQPGVLFSFIHFRIQSKMLAPDNITACFTSWQIEWKVNSISHQKLAQWTRSPLSRHNYYVRRQKWNNIFFLSLSSEWHCRNGCMAIDARTMDNAIPFACEFLGGHWARRAKCGRFIKRMLRILTPINYGLASSSTMPMDLPLRWMDGCIADIICDGCILQWWFNIIFCCDLIFSSERKRERWWKQITVHSFIAISFSDAFLLKTIVVFLFGKSLMCRCCTCTIFWLPIEALRSESWLRFVCLYGKVHRNVFSLLLSASNILLIIAVDVIPTFCCNATNRGWKWNVWFSQQQ